MKKSIAIIGLSRFGLRLVEALSRLNVDLVAIDADEGQVKKAGEFIQNAFIGDSTSIESLRAAGIGNVDHAIIAIGQNNRPNLSTSIITIIKLKELGVKEITARADEEDYEEVLRLVGATNTIMPLDIAADRIANKIANFKILDYFNVRKDYDIYELKIGPKFAEQPLSDINLRSRFNANILLIERGKELHTPNKDTILYPGDEVYIFGRKKDVNKVVELFK